MARVARRRSRRKAGGKSARRSRRARSRSRSRSRSKKSRRRTRRRRRKSQKGGGCPLSKTGGDPPVPQEGLPEDEGPPPTQTGGKKRHSKGGKRKMNAYMVAKEKARKGGAASFNYKGKTYHRKKTKTGMVIYSRKK